RAFPPVFRPEIRAGRSGISDARCFAVVPDWEGMIERAERRSVALLALVLVAVLLDSGDPEAGHATAVDRALPAGELLEAQRIALAGVVDAQETARHCRNDLGLPADHPAGGVDRRQRVERQRLAERSDDLGRTNLLVLEHSVTPA